jgi:hypothetical protein
MAVQYKIQFNESTIKQLNMLLTHNFKRGVIMATLVGSLLGNLSGKIGIFSAKTVNGKTIICARPKKFRVSNSPKCIETRNKFTVAAAFASCVSKVPELHEIWKPKKRSNMSVYNMIMKHNFKFVSSTEPTLANVITPDGFNSPVIDATISKGNLIGSIEAIDKFAFISPEAMNLSICAVISLSEPKNENEPSHLLSSLTTDFDKFNFSKLFDFEIPLCHEQLWEIEKYYEKIIFIAILIKSVDDRVIKYSKTASIISE